MTNSTPKLNNKVERHSPKWSGKKRSSPSAGQQQRKSAAPISIPSRNQSSNRWMSSSPSSSVSSFGSLSPKSPCSAIKNAKRTYQSPAGSPSSRNTSPRSSPTNMSFYAGAKFAEPPSPLTLPKPPMHWTGTVCAMQQMDCPFTAHLKMILKVQA